MMEGEDIKGDSSEPAPHDPEEEKQDVKIEDTGPSKRRGRKPKKPEHKFPVEPRIIQIVNKPRTYTNHTYRDYSNVPPEEGYEHPTRIEDMTFAMKVHDMLSQPEFSSYIAWCEHGRAFKTLIPVRLEQSKCLRKYFGHDRYSSFLRCLSNHGFKHVTSGRDKNSYYHEFMLRGLPHLTKYMPESRDARRLMPDPENEPDFYQISRVFPLPDMMASSGVSSTGKRLLSDEALSANEPAITKIQAISSGLDLPQFQNSRRLDTTALTNTPSLINTTSRSIQAQLLMLQQQQQQQPQQQSVQVQQPQQTLDSNYAVLSVLLLYLTQAGVGAGNSENSHSSTGRNGLL